MVQTLSPANLRNKKRVPCTRNNVYAGISPCNTGTNLYLGAPSATAALGSSVEAEAEAAEARPLLLFALLDLGSEAESASEAAAAAAAAAAADAPAGPRPPPVEKRCCWCCCALSLDLFLRPRLGVRTKEKAEEVLNDLTGGTTGSLQ